MQLSQIKADIRLRSAWEAIDLGFAMVQTWSKTIYPPWIIFMLILAVIVWFVVPDDKKGLAGVVIWWLKPAYDRFLLYIVSQELFSLEVGLWKSLKKIPSLMMRNGLISGLTYRRFSASRGFNLPIWQLEGLKGAQRSNRQNILHTRTHSQAVWLTIACFHIEVIFNLAFFGFVFLLLPSTMQESFLAQIFSNERLASTMMIISLLYYVFYVLAVVIVEPFYVAGSFSLYINRRTQLEAWDIELVFRNMADRLAALKSGAKTVKTSLTSIILAIILVTSGVSGALVSPVAIAEEGVASKVLPAEDSKDVIVELMKMKELRNKRQVTSWKFKEFDKKEDDKEKEEEEDNKASETVLKKIGVFFAILIEYALWIVLIVAVILLIIYREHWLIYFQQGEVVKKKKEKPDVLFGMDIRPDSLPDDISVVAHELWQKGEKRESLSLLYRGALAQLVNRDEVPLENSHTEGDVLKLSGQVLEQRREEYLERLTEIWRRAAYAHRFPEENDAQYLFAQWSQDFDAKVES